MNKLNLLPDAAAAVAVVVDANVVVVVDDDVVVVAAVVAVAVDMQQIDWSAVGEQQPQLRQLTAGLTDVKLQPEKRNVS